MKRSTLLFLSFFIITILAVVMFTNCSDNGTIQNRGLLTEFSGCKYLEIGNSHSYDHTSSEDCIDYTYSSEGTLLITHVNSAFNCCPGELTADVTISGSLIIIEEYEQEAACRCNCLYDLEYRIEDVETGIYSIKIITPYVEENEQLEFSIDLSSPTSGSYCTARDQYPWGLD